MQKYMAIPPDRVPVRVVAALALCLGGSAGAQASDNANTEQAQVREISIRAEQYAFAPNEIEVTQGETIRLTLEAVDVPHGIAIADLGVNVVARPGEAPAVVEFDVDTPGRFLFTCAVFCGTGHGRMRGVLTVAPSSSGAPGDGPDRVDDLAVDLFEPDFNLSTLPTTLRLPHRSLAFRLTHRFSRPLDGGPGFGNFAEDFFGLDSTAIIGLELRYGLAPGAQVGIYRNNDRNTQIFGRYNILWQGNEHGIGLDAYLSFEGANNLRDEHSPAVGLVLSKRLGERVAIYAEPIWVGNTNKPFLLHPEPGFVSADDDSMLLGLGTRIRALDTVYLVAEYVPRVSGFSNGDDQISFGLEKRAGGHLFQVNVSNGLGNTPAQIAGGADLDNWFLGFNITRKFF